MSNEQSAGNAEDSCSVGMYIGWGDGSNPSRSNYAPKASFLIASALSVFSQGKSISVLPK